VAQALPIAHQTTLLDSLTYAEKGRQAVRGQLLDDSATHVEEDRVIGQHQETVIVGGIGHGSAGTA
jgi:hypothetical protein